MVGNRTISGQNQRIPEQHPTPREAWLNWPQFLLMGTGYAALFKKIICFEASVYVLCNIDQSSANKKNLKLSRWVGAHWDLLYKMIFTV